MDLDYFETFTITLIFLSIFVGGIVKGSVGIGMSMFSVPIIAFILPPTKAMMLLCFPVIITNFTVDMPNEVDYVATGIVGDQGEPKIDYGDFAPAKATQTGNQMDITWAPAESQFTVTCQPIYSRDKVEKFNYQSFVNGEGIKGGYV